MKWLIVNADDFNTDVPRSMGIIEASRKGIVTSTTIIANMPWDKEVLAKLRESSNLAQGCHLNLTRGKPLTGGKSLSGERGLFYPKEQAWQRALAGLYDLNEIRDEFVAQVEECQKLGLAIDHVDGNNHIHVFPGINSVVSELLKDFAIKHIRLPLELPAPSRPSENYGLLAPMARGAASIFAEAGLSWTTHFAGMVFPDLQEKGSFFAFLASLPEGVTELMCHPGYVGCGENPYSNECRQRELDLLCHDDVIQFVEDNDIKLTSFGVLNK